MILKMQRNLLWNPRNGNIKRHSAFCGHVVAQKSKKKFPCRVITNKLEIMKLGYAPSGQMTPENDYEMNELIKKIA